MKEIEIDNDVFFYLQSHALPYLETPNMTLRRLFGLDPAAAEIPARAQAREALGASEGADVPGGERFAAETPPAFLSNNIESLPIRQDGVSTRKRTRHTKTSLRVLIREGAVSEGQRLFLHGYDGQRIPGPEFQATIQGRNLIWAADRQAYSMSDLATNLLKRLGHQATSVRGPSRWYTGEGFSIQDLWAERDRRNRKATVQTYPSLEDHIPMAAR
jgi:hypothetical protein